MAWSVADPHRQRLALAVAQHLDGHLATNLHDPLAEVTHQVGVPNFEGVRPFEPPDQPGSSIRI